MICRLCLIHLNVESAITLFNSNENNAETILIKMIAKYFQLEISLDDTISTSICNECWMHLDDFDKFCKHVEQKQSNLRNEFLEIKCTAEIGGALAEGTVIENNEESLLDMKDVIIECGTQVCEISKEEFGYANMDQDTTGTDIYKISAKKRTKVKSATIEKQCKKRKTSKADTKTKLPKKGNTLEESATTRISTRKSSLRRSIKSDVIPAQDTKISTEERIENETTTTSQQENDKSIPSTDTTKPVKHSSAQEWRESDTLISNNMRLKCELCDVEIETFPKLKTHFRLVHKTKAYALCCGKRFRKRSMLVDHIRLHLNPNYYQCKICNKNMKRKSYLEMHMDSMHAKDEDMKWGCTVCGKKFGRLHSLNIHSLVHKTEKNFACQQCDKAFVTKGRLDVHIKAIHENHFPYVCDICGTKFKYKPSFDRHVADHNGIQIKKMEQCNICGEWFKHLEKHIRKHNETAEKCDICGRICPSNRALKAHISYTHEKKRNLQCNFCEKAFKTKKNLTEHIAMHTGEKHHKCAHCFREFRSRSNMYMHIKRDHFEEWKISRALAKGPPPDLLTT